MKTPRGGAGTIACEEAGATIAAVDAQCEVLPGAVPTGVDRAEARPVSGGNGEGSVREISAAGQSLNLSGVDNARELGGYPAGEGRRVKRGVLLRTARLTDATDEDIRRLKDDYHLSVVLDLRMARELKANPDPVIEGVEYLHLSVFDEEALAARRAELSPEEMEGLNLKNPVDSARLSIRIGLVHDRMYIDFLSSETGRASYRQMFRELLDLPEGEALLFHCTQGKDRTGCAAMLILSALGVDEQTILADYALTNAFNEAYIESDRRMLTEQGVAAEEFDAIMTGLDWANVQYMRNALDWMQASYGSAVNYIKAELGVTDEDLNLLRDKFLEMPD